MKIKSYAVIAMKWQSRCDLINVPSFSSLDDARSNNDPINVTVKKTMETGRPSHGDSSYLNSQRKDSEINAEELILMSSSECQIQQ